MTPDSTKPIDCPEVQSSLHAFLANEIPADRSAEVQGHLDRCEECRGYRSFEEEFNSLLARGITRDAADPSLAVRIHEALRGEDGSPAARAGGAAHLPWHFWASVAALVLAVVVPSLMSRRGDAPAPPAAPQVVPAEQILTGTLVCSGCERHGWPVAGQRGCRAFGHHSALKCEKTGLWEFVETDLTRPLLTAADRVGDKVEVRGVFMPDIHYVKVTSFRYLDDPKSPPSGL